jgi:hypothetical protein
MNHASGEEAVGAAFTDGRTIGKAKRAEQEVGSFTTQDKRKRRDRGRPNPTQSQRPT